MVLKKFLRVLEPNLVVIVNHLVVLELLELVNPILCIISLIAQIVQEKVINW